MAKFPYTLEMLFYQCYNDHESEVGMRQPNRKASGSDGPRGFFCALMRRTRLMPQRRLLLPPQPLHNQRAKNTPDNTDEQRKQQIRDVHVTNFPPVPD